MAIGLGAGAAIAAGASLLGTAGNAVATGKLNKATRKWNEKMWNLQNAYNLPEAQMERFKQAGLNPNLIYGQGTSGNADSPKPWSPSVPDMTGIGGAVGKYFSTKLQQGQLERQRTENAILATDLASKKLDLDVKNKLTNVMVPDSATSSGLSSTNMLYEGALSGLQEKRYRADRARIANVLEQKTLDANISRIGSQAINEAARTGLITAHTANTLTRSELVELDSKIKEYELNFLENFKNIKSTDLMKMLQQAVPFLIQSMFKK
ncbi:MAG: hypothetical protein QW778_04690 [Candidatus Micrarchaeaceae archaeon]